MKLHVDADSAPGLVHTFVCAAGSVADVTDVTDVTQAHALLHGQETIVLADTGYQGVKKREVNQDATVHWHVGIKRVQRRPSPDTK